MRRLFAFVALFALSFAGVAQQPQTQTAPTYPVNAKYVNGVAPGYAPTAGSGLTLNLGGGTVNCAGNIVTYAAGTLTLTASTINYIYLNTASSCAPAVKTTTFTVSDIPIATVVTGASTITSIADVRTMFQQSSSGGGGITALTGDVTATGPGSAPAVLATVNASAGSCGDSTHVCQMTTNGKGLVTAQTPVPISASGATPTVGFNIGTGAAATPAWVQTAITTGSLSYGCTFTTLASDASTALSFNVKLGPAGSLTSIFSGGTQTIAAGTAAGTQTNFTGLTSTPLSVTAGNEWELDITGGTSSWKGSLVCR